MTTTNTNSVVVNRDNLANEIAYLNDNGYTVTSSRLISNNRIIVKYAFWKAIRDLEKSLEMDSSDESLKERKIKKT